MTSGVKTRPERRVRRVRPARRALLTLLLVGAARPSFAAAAFDLAALMALLAQRKRGETRFSEERIVSTLDSPLRASGTLSFEAPDRFTRQTLEPRPERMSVQGNTLELQRGGRTRRLALDAVPELAALVDAIRGTLGGDAAALQRHFRVQVGGSAAQWSLRLTPSDARLANQVREIQIVGQRSDVRSIELDLAGGDRSLMLVEPMAAPAASGAAR